MSMDAAFQRMIDKHGRMGTYSVMNPRADYQIRIISRVVMNETKSDVIAGDLAQQIYEYRFSSHDLLSAGCALVPARPHKIKDPIDGKYRTIDYAEALVANGICIGWKVIARG